MASSSEPTSEPGACALEPSEGHFQMEALDRGLIAVRNDGGNFVAWRMLGYEYTDDAARVAYNLYRNDELVQSVTDSTNFFDANAPEDAEYAVSVVVDGAECPRSATVGVWSKNYISIPLEPPPSGSTASGEYNYVSATSRNASGSVSDGTPGDLDGDGTYELVVIWDPSNSQDNSNAGHTGPVYDGRVPTDGRTFVAHEPRSEHSRGCSLHAVLGVRPRW